VEVKKGFSDVDPLRLGVGLESLLVPRGKLVKRVLWIAALLFELRVERRGEEGVSKIRREGSCKRERRRRMA
jgi:hypothetical protein